MILNLLLTLVQSSLVYLGPILLGSIISELGKKTKASFSILNLPYDFAYGALAIFGLALLTQYIGVGMLGYKFELIFFPIVHAAIILSLGKKIWDLIKKKSHINARVICAFVGVSLLALISYGSWVVRSPYSLNWDWYQHQTMSTLIESGKFSFFTSQLSDTFGFNSYPPFLHTLVAIAQYPSKLSPDFVLSFWQSIGYWHLVTVGLVVCGLSWAISKNNLFALLSTIVAVFTFDPVMSFTSYFFLPQTLTAVLFVGLLPKLIENKQKNDVGFVNVVLVSLALFLTHYMVGAVAAAIILGLWIYQKLYRKHSIVANILMVLVISIMAGIMFALMKSGNVLANLNHGEAQQYLYSMKDKLFAIVRTYGYFAYALVPLGLAWVWNKRKLGGGIVLLIFAGLLMAVFTQVPYIWKLFTMLRFFVGLLIAGGVCLLINPIRNYVLRTLAVIVFTVGLIINLVMGNVYWKDGLAVKDNFEHISSEDVGASKVLFDKYQTTNTLLISDPATQFVLEGIGGVDTVGGAYMPNSTREDLSRVLDTNNPNYLVEMTKNLSDGLLKKYDKRVIAISGRTNVWQSASLINRLSFSYNVWTPQDLSLSQLKYIDSLKSLPGVTQIYSSPSIYLFEVEVQ